MNQRIRLFLAALADDQAYARRTRVLWVVLLLALAGVVCIFVGYAYALYTLWRYWPTLLFSGFLGSVGALWPTSLTSLGMLVLLLMRIPIDLIRLQNVYSSEQFALALAMRRALEAGDASLTPVAEAQVDVDTESASSHPLPSASSPADAESLTMAIPAALTTGRAGAIVLYYFAALLVAAGIFAVAISGYSLRQLQTLSPDVIGYVVICGVLTLGGLLLLLPGWRLSHRRAVERRGAAVALDELGLTFRQPVWKRRRRRIAWADMRSLGQIIYMDNYTRLHTVYFLDGGAQTLLWEEPPTERYAPQPQQQTIAAQQASARRLLAEITRRTRLPLRDLSGTATRLTSSSATTTTSSTSIYSPFLKAAYEVAVLERDAETASALWRLRQPHARRRPSALTKLIEASSGAETPGQALGALPAAASPRFLRWAEQMHAARISLQWNRGYLLQVARALIPYYPTEDSPSATATFRRYLRHERARRSLTWLAFWLQIVLLIIVLLTPVALSHTGGDVETLMRAMAAQTRSQTPRYYASLAWPQRDWTVQKPSKDDPTGAAFVKDAYQVTCVDKNSSAIFTIPQYASGDIAISLTVTIQGHVTQDNALMAGLVFDAANNGNTFSTFGVDEFGNWDLSRYDEVNDVNNPWNSVDSNANAAIHTGDGATNTLLLVRHGPLYLLYVNDTLVDHYYDSASALPRGGGLGVYIGGSDIVGRFNHFIVYPVPHQLAAIPLTTDVPTWFR